MLGDCQHIDASGCVGGSAHSIALDARAGRSWTSFPARGRALAMAGVFLVMIAVGYASVRTPELADAATVAVAKQALIGIVAADMSRLDLAGLGALALLFSVVLLKPLLLSGVLLTIELWVGPAERSPKNYALVWILQALLLVCATLVQRIGIKVGLVPSEPLFGVGQAHGPVVTALWTFALYLVALLAADFIHYWFHRAKHAFAPLWRFHAIHHSPRDLDVLHNITHPLESAANFLIIAIPSAFLIPAGAGDLTLFAAFLTIQAQIIHMNVPIHFGRFGAVICDNRYHFVHHSVHARDHDSNFAGMFPLFDMLFGTYRKPAAGALPETGLAGQEAPATLGEYLLARTGSPRRIGPGGCDEARLRARPAGA